jgi:hypothetical protein
MEETNDYVLIQSKKLAEIKYKALQKRAANLERPLSEASIEATVVIEVVNYIYENNEWFNIHNRSKSDKTGYQEFRYTKFKIIEKEIEKISEDEARIREILNDPSSYFVGYSQEGYNLHIWINQGKKYYIEPELNRINRIEY